MLTKSRILAFRFVERIIKAREIFEPDYLPYRQEKQM
jgi:hypothetical protein